jgi:hypothetical protein
LAGSTDTGYNRPWFHPSAAKESLHAAIRINEPILTSILAFLVHGACAFLSILFGGTEGEMNAGPGRRSAFRSVQEAEDL